MANSRAFVAIDLGATSGRMMLSRCDGRRVGLEEVHRFPNEPVCYNRELHWNLPRIWREIQAGFERLDAPVESIGVDTWGVDYALLGEDGALVGNPYHYRDSRTDGVMEEVLQRVSARRIYEITGIQFLPFNTLYQLYAAQTRTPRLLAAATHLVTIPDLINFWLTGKIACEYTNASTTQFLSQSTGAWAGDLLGELGLPVHFLTPVVPPGTVLGLLQQGVTAADAVRRAKVVAPACHDTGSAVASVATGEDTAFISSGTWSLLGAEVPRAVVTPVAEELNFTNEGGVCGTTRLLKNITGLWLLECCISRWTHEGRTWPWTELVHMAMQAAPARSLIDPDHRSFLRPADMPLAIDEFCRATGQPSPREPGEYVRAILESLALRYRHVLEELESVAGRRFRRVRVIGGGSRNDLLNQLTADITGRTVVAGPVEATALGNVAMQMLVSGCVCSLAEAREQIAASHPGREFQPSGADHDCAWRTFSDIARHTSIT